MLVAVIPARGGSKRIPRKNIREFDGKPMIAYSIDCALRSRLFDRVIVSTDDQEIARVAGDVGAEVPFMRPHELADDHTGTIDVIAHTVDWLRTDGTAPDAVCCIYATAPFICEEDLEKGRGILDEGPWKYVFSATSYEAPVQRSFVENADGGLQMCFPEQFHTRSQDLPVVFHDAAQFYWGRSQAWLDRVEIFAPTSSIVSVPRWQVQDIDTEEDWLRAETMMGVLRARELRP